MADYVVTTATEPLPADAEVVQAGLRAFNERHAGPQRWIDVEIYLRDESGNVRGGLLAKRSWEWLSVEILWVEEELRGGGLGSQLLVQAEREAREGGCTRARLDTFEFQALPFYERHGYSVFAVLDDYPPGFKRYYLAKSLMDDAKGGDRS